MGQPKTGRHSPSVLHLGAFEPYTRSLEGLLHRLLAAGSPGADDPELLAALDGQASHRLRELVKPAILRAFGAFFTSRRLCDVAMRHIGPSLSEEAIILDPACGAGDLLLSCTQHLAPGEDRRAT